MSYYTYDELRTDMDNLIRALSPASDHLSVLAGGGVPTIDGSGDYETVDFSTGDVSMTPTLVGSAFAPPDDLSTPEAGPSASLAGNSLLAIMAKAIIEKVEARDAEIKSKVNALITDYNSRFTESFATID